ncbi:hypothetical protein K493DRAFT_252902 [Basidiobolus meristosporus CBS 931.73]|uniref:HD domain-containing protein n=1 Tax=Basidiobolus meristosporus CBS 931.73 TaxID=1314790 RepID=A0A1Y1Z611_9FUNG|nr:hypothetical protein K493DRAFT_252902 [Basidiobolus meristosporus CBS 931.73]|eukprot:ORY05245.1 hypothetical protein K493DRAFT_252902 [Basidiobolus meristosporus CBS 931.73]
MSTVGKAASFLQFFHICEKLKRTKRTGWIKRGVNQPESIADHMHRMSIMALLIDDKSLNRDRCMKMAAVHDLAEAIVGDITPHCGVSKEDKYKLEHDAMVKMVDTLGNSEQAQEIFELWKEYEAGRSSEALLVKDLDKFEMIVQAIEYEKSDNIRLNEFFESTRGVFQHPQVKQWVEELYAEREATSSGIQE